MREDVLELNLVGWSLSVGLLGVRLMDMGDGILGLKFFGWTVGERAEDLLELKLVGWS